MMSVRVRLLSDAGCFFIDVADCFCFVCSFVDFRFVLSMSEVVVMCCFASVEMNCVWSVVVLCRC